jgi:hypothetical protein
MYETDVYQKGVESVLEFLRNYLPEQAVSESRLAQQYSAWYLRKDFSDVTFSAKGIH